MYSVVGHYAKEREMKQPSIMKVGPMRRRELGDEKPQEL
jgi:hypothetical protein